MENKKEQKEVAKVAKVKDIVSKEKLLEAGAYFGHKSDMWNPKMALYIHMKKFGTHIINLAKTAKILEYAYQYINKSAQKKASFIFVGTKKIAKDVIEEQAIKTGSYFVSERWLGGTFTNHSEIFKRVSVLETLEAQAKKNFEGYTKKEGLDKAKKLAKLQANFKGIRKMKYLPHIMIVADPLNNMNAIHEARQKGIKIIGIADTNFDPDLLDIAIPANDDSTKTIKLIITILADAISAAKKLPVQYAYKNDEEIDLGSNEAEKGDK
ncbi:30S ribosomal protein S2 [Mycoplasma phocimorsus]|uniref:Small ribosomal subunit protein uS2 n=1 Tax=Mycoplasma phocimorsus TaxID=3045839 RepID=A0AAJ1PTX5_9MOLU|nr:30S ribosomal protein S2 [Mycoplasma phocimorsus]MDJ1645771.1 30S ribosomal protein S2 [Mycoplasma phocimorsus]MDJ1646336.1 30S ribosomal protein S2 [Mycoplasma phocimorsus]MDJ1647259.1 30S ribosomal protein S2 [Mycoplasma phocimorsus]MDJ1647907.1 30S ribosomal protein S2 [Mycoplasma phocimorsus]MDJ1648385.1 30S ribosomal protein S2 [Mycoplasma phocimorsus]